MSALLVRRANPDSPVTAPIETFVVTAVDVRKGAVYGRLSVGKGFVRLLHLLVGAAMYPTFGCGLSCAAGHNAIRAAQVPIVTSHSKVHGPSGFS